MGSFLEHFGYTFCLKKRTGAPKVPRERPKAPTPEINSSFGIHLEVTFRTFLEKMHVRVVLFPVLFRSHVFGGFLVAFEVGGTLKT